MNIQQEKKAYFDNLFYTVLPVVYEKMNCQSEADAKAVSETARTLLAELINLYFAKYIEGKNKNYFENKKVQFAITNFWVFIVPEIRKNELNSKTDLKKFAQLAFDRVSLSLKTFSNEI